VPEKVAAQITSQVVRSIDGDPLSIERGVRQRLADKISDNTAGLWLLVPEHLRLGTWDLLCGWTRQPAVRIEPRLAMQLVHEAALCLKGVRERRCVALRGFELLNGLPFLATDTAVHLLLNSHTQAEAEQLQVALGKIRRSSGHFAGKLLLIDPHRPYSYSRRHVRRHRKDSASKPVKTGQMFFCLDGDTAQPVCCTIGTSARTVTEATPGLLGLASQVLTPGDSGPLVAADAEHFAAELIDRVHLETPFDIITPIANRQHVQKRLKAIPPEKFTRQWAGFATAVLPYTPHNSRSGPYYELVQRQGERPDQWHFNSFLSTTDRDPVEALTRDYPKRWHLEEFFNFNQALGWQHAGTLNLHIRYGQMTMALLAQAAIHQFRKRLGEPYQQWDAKHLASSLFRGLEGDIRVVRDTIVVTYYNAPNAELLRRHYESLPAKLVAEGVDPRMPWLYDFKLDFRFK
jgi:hypothetical protein